MAAKLPVEEGETDTATLMSYGFDPELASRSPFHGAMYAVIDSVAKIAAMGGDYRKIRLTSRNTLKSWETILQDGANLWQLCWER